MNRITIIDKGLSFFFLKFIPKWVTPNHLTIMRFLSIPFVLFLLVLENYPSAIVLFSLSAFTDALDGALARTTHQVTEWGKMYDPVADKILIGTVVALVVSKNINPWLALTIICLELFIVLAALYKKNQDQVEIEAKKAGKVKMVFQSFGVGFLLLFLIWPVPLFFSLSVILLYLSLFFAALSLFVYKSI